MAEKAYASTADIAAKTVSLTEIEPDLYACTVEDDPDSHIIGDDTRMTMDIKVTP